MKGGTRKRGKSWSYYFDAASIGGKRKKIEKGGFRTKKDAEAALAKALAEYDSSGSVFTPSEISVSDYLDFWFDEDCKMNHSNKTITAYESIIRNHIKPQFGAYHLKDLHAAPIQSFINKLKKEGYSKSTIHVMLAILGSALDYAVEPLCYIRENPCRRVKVGEVPKPARQRTVLTNEQFAQILELFPPESCFHIPIMLGWNCGLRVGECMGLTWDDVDFEMRTISVDRQMSLHRASGQYFWSIKDPKNHSKRVIPFGETLYKALKTEKRRQAENELQYGEYYTIQHLNDFTEDVSTHFTYIEQMQKGTRPIARFPLVCRYENGQMLTPLVFNSCARKIRISMGIYFDYHCLRHSHATKLIEAGVSAKATQVRLGHKQITTTMTAYVHHTDSMAQEAAAQFESVVNGSLPPS